MSFGVTSLPFYVSRTSRREATASPELARRGRAAEVGRRRSRARRPRRAPARSASSVAAEPVAEQQRGRAQHRRRVRDAWPAIWGAEPWTGSNSPGPSSPSGGGGGEPETAGHRCGDVREDVAERVLGDDDVDRLGRVHDRHRERVDEGVVEWDIGVLGRAELGDDVPPEPRRVHDVDLVDRGERARRARARARRRGGRCARPPAACTRTCRTRCRRRASPWRRSRGRR